MQHVAFRGEAPDQQHVLQQPLVILRADVPHREHTDDAGQGDAGGHKEADMPTMMCNPTTRMNGTIGTPAIVAGRVAPLKITSR